MLKLPPPLWALVFLIAAGVASALYPWRALFDLRVVWLGVALVVCGFGLSFWAAMLFRRDGTELNPVSESNKTLVVRGPFRFTRNPMYLGLFVLTLGIAIWVGSLPMLAVPLLVFGTANWGHIPFEEAKMRRQFGASYDQYTDRVRRWI
ncbi:MAG: isoprenylcysteine carboxylmethyltransferase family protein [Proteobacteria bacterium]|nr:isoprenylcysteine carboxylmethyltransferase family protein [Pseudomonadota bacterium]